MDFPAVSSKGAGGRKFSQLVTNHVLGNIYRDELAAIMYRKRYPDEFRRDCRTPSPGLDHLFLILSLQLEHFMQ